MKQLFFRFLIILLTVAALTVCGRAGDESFDMDAQLDALGKDELMERVPDDARDLMEEMDIYDLSVDKLLQLAPKDFFSTLWQLFLAELKKPLRTLGIIGAVTILCAMLSGLRTAFSESALSQMFTTIAMLSVLTSVVTPILDCIVNTSQAVHGASLFMLSFIPIFSAALVASGQPVTGAGYDLFLFSTCQVISQVVAQTLIPLMGIYLALCIVGALAPEIHIASATATIKKVVSWALGFSVTIFVGLLSIQTMVSQGADSVTSRAAKFVVGSFVPVIGSSLSEALTAARGCLQLIKTSVGAYGILAAAFTFLPILLRTVVWYAVTGGASIAGDLLGVGKISEIMKSCNSVLGILIAIILSYALLIIVSITVVMVVGAPAG